MSFESIIGNNEIKQKIKDIVKKNTVSNSYMFLGQEGIGKILFAKEFAKMLLCMSENDKTNCYECESCLKFDKLSHPDYTEIKPDGGSIKISQIREMLECVYQKPILSEKKVFVINDADKMTEEAQNSLLKTLEEPPKYITIILIVANENLLLNTVKSRCLRVCFNDIEKEKIETYIKENSKIENLDENILKSCNGSIGKAKRVIENIDVYRKVEKVIEKIMKQNLTLDVFFSLNILNDAKECINDVLDYIVIVIYNKFIKENEKTYEVSKIFKLINIVENTKKRLSTNANYEMCIDNMIFNMTD